MSAAGLKRWLPGLRATVIGIPYLWLLLFFAVPFLIVLMISFSHSRVGSPPYTWLLQYVDGGLSLKLNLENYLALFRDSIYAQAFLSSIKIAAISTFLTLLIGYPMAYAIARLSPAARNVAMMLVVLPSWTSFLIRVYAWKAILDRNGLLDQFLQYTGLQTLMTNMGLPKLQLIDTLRKKWFSFLGAKVEVKNFEQGVPILSPVEVRLFGDNLDTLRNLAAHVETMLLNTKGTVYVNNPVANNKSDFKVNVNREKALALGVPTVSIDRTVRMALAGLDVATYSDPSTDDNDYKIRVSMPRNSYPDLSVFDEIFVNNVQGTAVPLSQLATIEMEASPSTINHINRTRVVYVNSFVQKGFTNDKVIDDVIGQMEQMKMPSGYHYEMGGEVESRQESFGGFGTIIVITMFLFIAVLILEFKTFKSTLIVLSVIPLGIVGAVVALWLTGNTLSFVATIGLVALAGIEVKNTILLVDFTNQLRREGMELNEAIEKAGELRFLPIILTTLTAIGGLLPIAWSSNPMISPLAIVMIGGLISSTLLSRIVTPVVYKLIPPKIEDTNE